MEMIELMKERHSVRQYTDKKIEKEKREVLFLFCFNLSLYLYFLLIFFSRAKYVTLARLIAVCAGFFAQI
jgi:hypothetical protein